MSLAYEIEDPILVIKVAGAYTPNVQRQLVETATKLVATHSLTRMLFDFREADTTTTSGEGHIYSSTADLPKYYPSVDKFAVVSIVRDEDRDKREFFENVAFNHGIKVAVFTDYESAKKWLL